MATKRMLIDASHPEETRVVVVSGNRVEDFDVEVESRRQLKGNIYLAKVTRVEPSLQAAFVEYGGNRHGFLAFSEIHPDYYQIPVADREALMIEEEHAQRAAKEAEEAEDGHGSHEHIEEVGGAEDDMDEAEKARRPMVDRRRYKIQEVIKRRQILLVQVVKEERGNKGAALTTYLSLAGRYCVLMPNTARGGGISRKIASGQDRKRLKSILNEFGIPDGMAVIVRTAGAKRTKAEIKRDYEYLIRLWEQIRQKTLESMAPTLIHEEGNLIKRSIRDIYSKDLEEVIVEGDEGYRAAKDFMKLMMPSHAKRVQPYRDTTISLLQRYQVEAQIDSMHSPEVQLKSGGYIVINSTEALVAVDVNSGRSTRERNIEETALKTNIEAADEVARQLRLRDLAGLIVIDFIDMENHRNQAKVERTLKDAMRNDRARIQIGRISPFGLLEMSRQRLRPSLQEMHSEPCPHCAGTGVRRTADTTALQMLRVIEEEASKKRNTEITVHMPTEIALYILNQKRELLARIESDYELRIYLENDDTLIPPDYRIDRVKIEGVPDAPREAAARDQTSAPAASVASGEEDEDGNRKKRRRRGRRRGKRDDEQVENQDASGAQTANEKHDEDDDEDEESSAQSAGETAEGEATDDDAPKRPRRRRRGRRAGRRRNREDQSGEGNENQSAENADGENTGEPSEAPDDDVSADSEGGVANHDADDEGDGTNAQEAATDDNAETDTAEEKPARSRRRSRKPRADAATEAAPEQGSADDGTAVADTAADDAPAKPGNGSDPEPLADMTEAPSPAMVDETPVTRDESTEVVTIDVAPEPEERATPPETARTTVVDVSTLPAEERPSKRGWWRRG